MQEISKKLEEIGLNSDNAIVIGSGILNALNLRESKEENHGKEILINGLFEIGTIWTVIGKTWKFSDLLNYSVIINDVRYITIQFLLDVKKCWLADGDARQKDKDDIKLIENYLKNTLSFSSLPLTLCHQFKLHHGAVEHKRNFPQGAVAVFVNG